MTTRRQRSDSSEGGAPASHDTVTVECDAAIALGAKWNKGAKNLPADPPKVSKSPAARPSTPAAARPSKSSKSPFDFFLEQFTRDERANGTTDPQADKKAVQKAGRKCFDAMNAAELSTFEALSKKHNAEVRAANVVKKMPPSKKARPEARPAKRMKRTGGAPERRDNVALRGLRSQPASTLSGPELEEMVAGATVDLEKDGIVHQDGKWRNQKMLDEVEVEARSSLSGVLLQIGCAAGWFHKAGTVFDVTRKELKGLQAEERTGFVQVQDAGDLQAELERYVVGEEGHDDFTNFINLSDKNIMHGKRVRRARLPGHEPDPEPERPQKASASKRKKPMRTDEGSVYGKALRRIKDALGTIRQNQAYLDAYEGGGWGGHGWNKIKPESELRSSRARIRKGKHRMREIVLSLKGLYPGESVAEEEYDSDGIEAEKIACCVCKGYDCEGEGNDILLCDAKGCDRAYHQQCITPPPTAEDLGGPEDDWFCQTCDCRLDLLDLINDEFGTKYVDDADLFPEADVAESDDQGGRDETDSSDDDFDLGKEASSSDSDDEDEAGPSGEAVCEAVEMEPGELAALKAEAGVVEEEEEDEEDLENMGRGKRARKAVDYAKLAEREGLLFHMSDDDEDDGGKGEWKEGDKEDEDFTSTNFFGAMAAARQLREREQRELERALEASVAEV